MIDKKIIKKQGLRAGGPQEAALSNKAELLQQLRSIDESFVDRDGQVNLEAIKEVFGLVDNYSAKQSFQLSFAGKGIARGLVNTPTPMELKAEKAQSQNFDTSENIIIRGDNLDALKLLKRSYSRKIDLIYIDPPYNKRSEEFIYKDNFAKNRQQLEEEYGIAEDEIHFLEDIYKDQNHTGWASFIYPRLKLAKALLAEDGVIFISIDDDEYANLRIICDEIFGERNFQQSLTVVNCLNGNNNSSGMMDTHEYCLIYSKSGLFKMGVLDIDEEAELTSWEVDDIGYWKEGRALKSTGFSAPRAKRPNLFFPLYIDEKNLKFSLKKSAKFSYELLPMTNGQEMTWAWSKDKFEKEHNEVIIKKSGNGYNVLKKQRPRLGDLPTRMGKTTFYKPEYSTANATNEIKKIFGSRVFNTGKASSLIRDLILLGTTGKAVNGAKEFLVLDFFAGSGTTAEAVMSLNAEDGGKRKFILVQNDEKIDSRKFPFPYDFCVKHKLPPVISSICLERVKRIGKRTLKNNGPLAGEVDIGHKVFSLVERPKVSLDEELKLINKRKTTLDTLYNMMLLNGVELKHKIEELEKDKLYLIDGGYYVTGECAADLSSIQAPIYIDGYADIDLESWLNLAGIKNQNPNVIVLY